MAKECSPHTCVHLGLQHTVVWYGLNNDLGLWRPLAATANIYSQGASLDPLPAA